MTDLQIPPPSLLHPTKAEGAFRSFLEERGDTGPLTVSGGVDAMLEFFKATAFNPKSDGNPDMLLFQWGAHDWGRGSNFELDITRQLIWPSHVDAEEEELWKLSLTFRFELDEALRALGSGSHWCESHFQTCAFRKYISDSPAYQTVAARADAKSEIQFGSAD